MDFPNILPLVKQLLIMLPILFFSVILHECGHGIIANKFGDPTAKMMGRITLNPIPHIDLFGTIILPLILIILRSPFLFGWAKPVPVNFFNLRHPKRDMIWVSLGGVGVNILLAIIGIIALFILNQLPAQVFQTEILIAVVQAFKYLLLINVILAVFNLIPIPPLDGSRIVIGLLPSPYAQQYAKLERFGIIIVIALIYFNILNIVFNIVFQVLSFFFPWV